MTETTETPTIRRPIAEGIEDLDVGLTVSPTDLGERLWHFFISMRTGLVLILALAFLGLIGTLVIQAPAGLAADPKAHAVWVESVRPKYGGWTGVLDTLGLFSIFSSVWFRGITVLLMTSVLACSVNRAPHLWKLTFHPRTKVSEAFFGHAPLSLASTTAATPSDAAAVIETAFRARRFRTIVETEGDVVHVYADHNRFGPFGTVIAHLSLVFILVGALAGGMLGFRNDDLAIAVGSTVAIGNGTGLSVQATRFADSYYTNGSPSDYASDLVVYRDGGQVAAATIRVNEPLTVGDVTFYQSFFGAAAVMRIADKDGKVLFDQGVPLEWPTDDGDHVFGQIVLGDTGRYVDLVAPASGKVDARIKPGQIQAEIYETGGAGQPVDVQVLTQGTPASVAGFDLTFVRERQFTGLIAAKDPGVPFIWAGCLFLVAGTALVFFFPCRRAWAQVRRGPGGASSVRVAAVVRHDVGFAAEFEQLAAEIEQRINPTDPRT
jgi:cytochrome c biogenesis protein